MALLLPFQPYHLNYHSSSSSRRKQRNIEKRADKLFPLLVAVHSTRDSRSRYTHERYRTPSSRYDQQQPELAPVDKPKRLERSRDETSKPGPAKPKMTTRPKLVLRPSQAKIEPLSRSGTKRDSVKLKESRSRGQLKNKGNDYELGRAADEPSQERYREHEKREVDQRQRLPLPPPPLPMHAGQLDEQQQALPPPPVPRHVWEGRNRQRATTAPPLPYKSLESLELQRALPPPPPRHHVWEKCGRQRATTASPLPYRPLPALEQPQPQRRSVRFESPRSILEEV